jgi:hypothetical protein
MNGAASQWRILILNLDRLAPLHLKHIEIARYAAVGEDRPRLGDHVTLAVAA